MPSSVTESLGEDSYVPPQTHEGYKLNTDTHTYIPFN